MPAIRKSIQFSFRRRRYGVLDTKENVPENRNGYDRRKSESDFKKHETRKGEATKSNKNSGGNFDRNFNMRRSISMRLSVGDAIGTISQRLRTSTRRLRMKENKSAANYPPRRSPRHNARMCSSFDVDTPGHMPPMGKKGNPKWRDAETPTRLRREVEALTSNLQALSTLTPNTLQESAMAKRSSNGSIKKRKSPGRVQKTTHVRRRIETTIY